MRTVIDIDQTGVMHLIDVFFGDTSVSEQAKEEMTKLWESGSSLEICKHFDKHLHKKYILETVHPAFLAELSIPGEFRVDSIEEAE